MGVIITKGIIYNFLALLNYYYLPIHSRYTPYHQHRIQFSSHAPKDSPPFDATKHKTGYTKQENNLALNNNLNDRRPVLINTLSSQPKRPVSLL